MQYQYSIHQQTTHKCIVININISTYRFCIHSPIKHRHSYNHTRNKTETTRCPCCCFIFQNFDKLDWINWNQNLNESQVANLNLINSNLERCELKSRWNSSWKVGPIQNALPRSQISAFTHCSQLLTKMLSNHKKAGDWGKIFAYLKLQNICPSPMRQIFRNIRLKICYLKVQHLTGKSEKKELDLKR